MNQKKKEIKLELIIKNLYNNVMIYRNKKIIGKIKQKIFKDNLMKN